MKRIVLTLAATAMLLAMGAPLALAAEFGGIKELYVYPYVQYFTWEEFAGGRRLLKESGPQYGVGGAIKLNLVQGGAGAMTFKGRLEIFGGVVDYDGETTSTNQSQNGLPVKTDVVYFGSKEEISLGWAVPVSDLTIEPFAGLGYRWWLRDLQDTTTVSNNTTVPVSGYTENWSTLYTKLGLNVTNTFSPKAKVSFEGGLKYPFYNANKVDVAGFGEVTLKPESRWSAFAEVAGQFGHFRPALFYEGYRVDRSPGVGIGGGVAILQPQSDEDLFGLSLAWCFR